MKDLDALLSAHFDDGPTAESSAALRRWLAENPEHVDQFVELSHQHFELYDLLSQQKLSEGTIPQPQPARSPATPTLRRNRSVWYVAAAAVALMITAWFVVSSISPQNDARQRQASPIALLTNAENAVFADTATGSPLASIKLGSELQPSTLKLQSGSAQVMFRSGAVVDMIGPCEFEMTDTNRGRLHSGAIHTLVPPAASGFTVQGPGGVQVVDLGTEFEMRVDLADQVLVKVLEGTVQVIGGPNGVPQVMTAGRAARVHASTIHEIQLASVFTPSVESCSPTMHAVAAPPMMQHGRYQTPEGPIVFAERRGVLIDRTLEVAFTEPGMYKNLTQETEPINGPVRVDSYLIHFDPNPQSGGPMTPGKGQATFTKPILGIIATPSGLRETDGRFGAEQAGYTNAAGPRGMEDVDVITLSPDRRTIQFDWSAGHHSDQVRVLVQADEPQTP